jgi:hypothetical protein
VLLRARSARKIYLQKTGTRGKTVLFKDIQKVIYGELAKPKSSKRRDKRQNTHNKTNQIVKKESSNRRDKNMLEQNLHILCADAPFRVFTPNMPNLFKHILVPAF